MENIVFAHSRSYTLGVELEFQILDRQTLNLVSRAPAILAEVPQTLGDKVAPEFIRSILEIQTGICMSVDEVAKDLKSSIALLEQIAANHGSLLFSASLHPFAEPADQMFSVGERYQRIMDELQHVGRRFISQGLHVHVGIEDGDAAIAVCDVLQLYLPILLGLSCSSPYFRGKDTGLSSYRTKLFEALPLAGIAGYIGSWQGYVDEINLLRSSFVIQETKDLWWDIRPSPGFGTVEIRICDLPARFVEVLGLTSIMQAFAAAIVEGIVKPFPVSPQLLSANKWQAARHGLDGRFTDPLGLLPTGTQTIRQAAYELLVLLSPFFDRFGGRGIDAVQSLLAGKVSAEKQRALKKRHGSFETMIMKLHNTYWHE
jgi:carboxylate-amine ligase